MLLRSLEFKELIGGLLLLRPLEFKELTSGLLLLRPQVQSCKDLCRPLHSEEQQ